MREPIRVLYWGMTSNIGGIEAFIMNVYRNIDRKKVQIDFLLNHSQPSIAFEDEIKELGGRIYRVMYSERESIIKSRTELDKFFHEHKEFKAIHIHANFLYAFPLKCAKKYNIPIRILHSHNSSEDTDRSKGIKKLIKKYRNKLVRKQIDKYPNTYIACSDLAANYMFPNKEYIWVKNGIDIDKFKFNDAERKSVRNELGIKENEYVVGFIGRLREQKNPYFLIDIFREYAKIDDKARFLIAGIGEWEDDVKKYASDLTDNKSLQFLGKRNDADRLYQGFDVFLLPSLYEGLPVVLVESQVSGLKSYTSDVVTRQIDVTDLMKYYSLELSAKEWAQRIYDDKSKYNREVYADVIKEKGFDVISVAKELEKMYLE